jgi:hypothetical protein
MYDDFEVRRERNRRFMRSHVFWIIPAVLIIGPTLFYAFGKLVQWLWLVTLVDIFAIKPISFWQAWGLLLLAQFLFKANMQPTLRTGRWRRRGPACGDAPKTEPGAPSQNPVG